MRKQILELLAQHGILIEPQAMEHLLTKEEPLEYIKKILSSLQEYPLIITAKELKKIEFNAKSTQALKPIIPTARDEKQAELPQIKILQEMKRSTSSATLENFAKYFGSRYSQLRKMLRVRRELFGAANLAELRGNEINLKLIAIVKDARTSKEKHKILELEDPTGTATALIPNNSELIKEALVKDEVLGIVGRRSQKSNLIIVEGIIRPEFQVRPLVTTTQQIYAGFISDLHLGSKTFLNDAWENFITWLRSDNELAKNLRWLVISGDCIDGVGVYPKQEKDLELKDLFEQYKELTRKFSQIPSYIKIIVLPGNHDGVRQAEPQPPLSKELNQNFSENVIFTSNPCYFSLNGIEVLAYHGRSMDDFVTALPNASYTKPIMMMKEMLKRRHLAIAYGARTPIAPEEKDFLVINKVPHIFVTGHVHRAQAGVYKNIILINSSTWQSQTEYQAMQGFVPEPAKVAFVNLHSLEHTIVDFSS